MSRSRVTGGVKLTMPQNPSHLNNSRCEILALSTEQYASTSRQSETSMNPQ
jgi:hypothetical protein